MYSRHSFGRFLASAISIGVLLAASPGWAQPGKGPGPRGKGPRVPAGRGDATFAADRELFHLLLERRADIRREVKPIPQGVETLTESDRPDVAAAIQRHVASMEQRVKFSRPIHLRDPLFAEVFRHADQIKFAYQRTDKGVRVAETSDDPYVARLIQAHADVVSRFLQNGFDEVHRDHALPARP